ncbi:hypothetical protein Syun_017277 [Stephania yunnanensis]|uniref:Uncharacterized protein n=1 Tax=Stephania yunnanensis TaxID=152371 RepID=A0AAP0J7J9_9MAGN
MPKLLANSMLYSNFHFSNNLILANGYALHLCTISFINAHDYYNYYFHSS